MQWGGITRKEWADNKEGNRINVQGSNESVTLQHPIVYETYNICEIVDQSKLAKFSIQTLKNICAALELDVASMTGKCKQPYVEIIEGVVARCSCKTSTE